MRTPNGAADLLINDPSTSMSFPSHLESFVEADEEDELPPRSPRTADDSEIYKRLDSFERKMESELQDLEALGVDTGSDRTRKGLDPDGEGQRCVLSSSVSTATAATTGSSHSSSSSSARSASSAPRNNIVIRAMKSAMPATLLEKGKGKSGKKHDKLSRRTTKIMGDYQAYLNEIQVGYPLSFDSFSSSDDELAAVAGMAEELENPALATIAQVREDVKGSYLEKEGQRKQQPDAEEGGSSGTTSGAEPSREDGRYAVGEGHPLYRVWSDDNPPGTAYSSPSSSIHAGYDYATVFGESLLASGQSGDSCGRRRYRNAQSSLPRWLRSRRVQRGLGMVVLACILIGIYAGVSSIEKRESLPDWEREYEEEIDREWKDHEKEAAKMEMEGEIKMQPPWKQTEGGVGIQDKLAQMEKEKEEGEKKMMEEHSMAAAASAAAAMATEEATTGEHVASAAADMATEEATTGEPVASAAAAMATEEAATGEPVASAAATMATEEATTGEPAASASTDADDAAAGSEIGETAGSSDPVTGKEDNEKGLHEELAMDQYYDAIRKYNPRMFDRSTGWTGMTYVEALVFCDKEGGLAVCPYDAVCPKGVDGEPLGGYRDAPLGDWAWVPIVDDYDEWVQAGARERCAKYSHKNGKKPAWGTQKNGEDSDSDTEWPHPESLTQNIMCCSNVI